MSTIYKKTTTFAKFMAADLYKYPLGRHFGILTRLYYGALTKRMEYLDIERHFSILVFLNTSKKDCTQQYISDLMKIDKATMVRIIDYLTEKGLIRRVQNLNDLREYHIKLTGKAKKIMPRIHRGIKNMNLIATKGLSSKRIKDLYDSIKIISSNLIKEPSHKVIVNFKKAK